MGEEDNVVEEEMPKIGNCGVKSIIMDQCNVDIVRDLDLLNLMIEDLLNYGPL